MKKFISAILVLILMASSCPSFAQASDEAEVKSIYFDLPMDHWAYKTIEKCKTLGILGGYPDESFRSENNISYAEAIKALSVLSGKNFKVTPEGKLYGIDKDLWYAPYVYVCQNIIPDHMVKKEGFSFEKEITREDAIYLTAAALGYIKDFESADVSVLSKFTDKDDISADVLNACAFAVENGMVKGNPDKTIKPQDNISRAEFATLICTASGLSDNPGLKWVMENVTETNAIKNKDGMFFISNEDYFKAEFNVEADGYYNIEMGYTHDDYESYFRLDTTYADGSVGGFMQGLVHGKTKIEMKIYLKKGLNKINLRHHTIDGTFIYYIKNNGLTQELDYELSPKNENYFYDNEKELKTSIRSYRQKLVKIETDKKENISFTTVNKEEVLGDPGTPDDFYTEMIFVGLSKEDVKKLGSGCHTLYYHLENGVILEQKLNIADATPESKLKIINFSVDKANSTLIMLPNGKNLLVDSATKAMAKDRVIPYLEKNGIKLDYYLLTHFHSDHNGLKSQILKDNGIKSPDTDTAVKLSETASTEERYSYLKDFGYLDSKMLRYYDEIHKIWDLGGVEIDVSNSRYDENGNKAKVYHYPYMKNSEHNYENSTSVSFMLSFNGFRYYHCADNYGYNQNRYMADMIEMGRESELRSHWFFGNHHFINSINTEFINTLNPVVVYVPNKKVERRGAYWYHYKENVENYYFSHKRLADTLISIDTDNAKICVNSCDDWYYETFRY